MPRRKTVKRRNAKRRTLKRFKKKSKGGTEYDDNLPVADTNNTSLKKNYFLDKAKVLATTLRLLSPYKNCLYLDGYDRTYGDTRVEYYLCKGTTKTYDEGTRFDHEVIAFPETEYSIGINNYIYKNGLKQEQTDLFYSPGNFKYKENLNAISLQGRGDPDHLLNPDVKYIFLAINYNNDWKKKCYY